MLDSIAALGIKMALDAGKILLEGRQGDFRIESKANRQDLVTEYDRRVEAEIISQIHAAYPDHAILGEESGASGDNTDYQWVIDPLDGTMNFAHRYPIFSVSIAFKAHGVTEWGGIFVPALGEMYTAFRGRGAYLGERQLRVSAITEMSDALITTGFPTTKATDPDNNLAEVAAVTPNIGDLRRSGSAAFDLTQVAIGRIDAFWEYALNEWDIAAGALMVNEAGGRVSTVRDEDAPDKKRGLLASNGHLHDVLHRALRDAHAK